jgi:iron complex transport system permease protein
VIQPFAVRYYRFVLLSALILVLILCVLHIGVGSVELTPSEVIAALLNHPYQPFHRIIVWDLRMPRTLIALLAGAMFGLAGAILQSIMRNPLAEPEMTGATSGAVLLAVLFQTWTADQPEQLGLVLPLVALLGGLLAGGIVYVLSWQRKSASIRLILTGILVSAVLRSCTSMLLLLQQDTVGNVLLWLIGSLDGRVWVNLQVMWPWAALALPFGLTCAGLANALQLGDMSATSLGVNVTQARTLLLFAAILLTSTAVAVVGGITFLGLIAPHIARRIVGSDARRLFPFSMILGAIILLAADILSQILFQPTTLPVGAILAVLGAPFFLYLVWRSHS